jgi:CubicO group peptidase (beta-lactamase class C family)
MLRIISSAGSFGIPLTILTLLLVVLILRASWHARRASDHPDAAVDEGRAAILFWGFVAAILGFLGQCAALYHALGTVIEAKALDPTVLAEGFATSFVTTLWGVGLLLLAGLAWLSLRWLARSRAPVVAMLLLSLVGVFGCGSNSAQAPVDITNGVWAGSAGGDTFLFDLRGAPPDSLVGTVHVMRDGKMTSELAITRASYHAPALEMFIESTNATYKGRVDASRRRITGGLTFGGAPGSQMELRWTDPKGLPGFAALPGDAAYVYRKPADGSDGWQTATPEEVDMDRGAVTAMVNDIARDSAGLIQSLQIVRHGKLVVDEYFHGYGPDDLHRLRSATKSISSLLVGAAIDRGLISGVDAPILGLLHRPEAPAGSLWNDETLADLLTMSMGLDWSAHESLTVLGTGPAFFEKVLGRKVTATPGTQFSYASANVSLLAGVIFNATGKHAEAFAREVLFSPLGIGRYDWAHGKTDGYNHMDSSLALRPRDLAKIGALVAAGGRWDGRQVISEAWIKESTRTHIATGGSPALGGYGYLWWTGQAPSGHGTQPLIAAVGMGSQFTIIFPQLDMVIVVTGGNGDNGREMDVGRVLFRTLLPSM